ncbi:MAG: response regulator transcription factor [Desulfobacteraceae bacterium]|nr:response regulator transcription factor [Desulfobacteraceae bacterium]
MKKAKVLIVDDHQVVIGGIRCVVNELPDFEVVGEACNGRDGVKLAIALRADIVIMDISMPDLNGIDATLQLKKKSPETHVIIFTMYSDKEYLMDLIRAGISAYVLKEDPISDLILALKAVRSGGTYFSTMSPQGLLEHIRQIEQTDDSSGFKNLSLREREVLQLLAEGNNVKEIACKLNLSPKTVESHKYSLMAKLDVHNIADLTKIAIKKKLISP